MERFRLNIDITDVSLLAELIPLAVRTIAENPDQPVGNGGIIKLRLDDNTFDFVRNFMSYTIREVT